jgi:hypothetical protein
VRSIDHLNRILPRDYNPIKPGGAYSGATVVVSLMQGVPSSPDIEPCMLLPAWSADSGHFPVMLSDGLYMTLTDMFLHNFYYSPVSANESRGRLMKCIPWDRRTTAILLLRKAGEGDKRPKSGFKFIQHHIEAFDARPLDDAPDHHFCDPIYEMS